MNHNDFLSLRRKIMEMDFARMNEVQRQAVFHTEGALLILAGAGSGKTTVVVNRIANIIKYGNAYNSEFVPENLTDDDMDFLESFLSGNSDDCIRAKGLLAVNPAKPWQIMAITFTNKAAGELKERLESMLGENAGVWASTFHSSCARILRRDAEKIGYSSHFTIYDTDDTRRLMKDVQVTLRIDDKMMPHKAILGEISRAKDSLLSPSDYLKAAGSDARKINIAKAYALYQTRLKDSDAMDFDDLLMNSVVLLRENPDVLEYYHRKFKYIMVDEYQDTNHAQYMFIKLLSGGSGNICVVGDDDQSIYKFRGATIENILGFENFYSNAKTIRLEQNYRSTQNILDAANAVIKNNSERKGKNLWTSNGTGDKITIHKADNEQAEGEYIAEKILENVKNGSKYSDHAVLYRMNAQSNSIEGMLVRMGVPYRIIGGHRFYERKEIRDMTAYLNVINNSNDDVRLRRIINVPKRGIGDRTISVASEIAEGLNMSLLDVLRTADEFESLSRARAKIKVFTNIIDSLIEAHENGTAPNELYELILEKTQYNSYLKAEYDDFEDRIENIKELSSSLVKYSEDNGEDASLAGFLEEVSLMTDIDNYDSTSDSVILMTIHSAKGLEFPTVFLPGMEDGLFPGMQVIYNPKEIEEERRLAYVAITRAKKSLYITHAASRMLYGHTSRNRLSRFASEIPLQLVDSDSVKVYYREDQSSNLNAKPASSPAWSYKKPESKAPPQTYSIGETVLHNAFGQGTIVSCTPMGNDTLLEINFEKVGSKKVMANFAKLKKL